MAKDVGWWQWIGRAGDKTSFSNVNQHFPKDKANFDDDSSTTLFYISIIEFENDNFSIHSYITHYDTYHILA